ncbi:MAG: serine/threonine protein kinase, partial [Planctomycetes bacterium]|nr:serine/threonine protein kinase [Planctomycetota bacterium]
METPPTEDRSSSAAPDALAAFLRAYWTDRDSGQVRPLAAYLAQFPGAELAIAEEYLALEKGTPDAGGGEEEEEDDGSPGLGPGLGLALGGRNARFGHYRLLRELGRGGQGEVYLAEDTRLKRKVALKILTTMGPLSETLLGRFRREAEVASRLDDPGICTVFDAGDVKGVPFIAMRYVEGESLAVKIAAAREQAMGAASAIALDTDSTGAGSDTGAARAELLRIARLFEQVARSLHVAHRAAVIHRDIKPGNIVVTPDLVPVILDFGLARELDSDQPT